MDAGHFSRARVRDGRRRKHHPGRARRMRRRPRFVAGSRHTSRLTKGAKARARALGRKRGVVRAHWRRRRKTTRSGTVNRVLRTRGISTSAGDSRRTGREGRGASWRTRGGRSAVDRTIWPSARLADDVLVVEVRFRPSAARLSDGVPVHGRRLARSGPRTSGRAARSSASPPRSSRLPGSPSMSSFAHASRMLGLDVRRGWRLVGAMSRWWSSDAQAPKTADAVPVYEQRTLTTSSLARSPSGRRGVWSRRRRLFPATRGEGPVDDRAEEAHPAARRALGAGGVIVELSGRGRCRRSVHDAGDGDPTTTPETGRVGRAGLRRRAGVGGTFR